jgi:uncharacterized protein (TIGR03790 family)
MVVFGRLLHANRESSGKKAKEDNWKERTFAYLLQWSFVVSISAWSLQVYGGGSGLNTLVVVNQNSSNSCEVGNYYCERRQVPPENLLRINWPGSNLSWTSGNFQTNLVTPLLAALAARQLTNQIDYVVLSMDIPYQTINQGLANGTTTALFYGLKADSGPDWPGITNSYYASEQIFSKARPESAPGYSFLTTMVTADSVAQAKKLIEQGVRSDGAFPTQRVMLAKSSDPMRNIRYKYFDNVVFNTRVGGNCVVLRTNCDSLWGQTNLLGWETGLANFGVATNSFVPGAMADSMTSFGGLIFGQTAQTTLMDFINAGAAGSYGTVTEPSAVTAKFPDPQNYYFQSRGFGLAECYYQSLFEPYEGLVVGEPLAAPFQRTASGQWLGASSNAVLSGTAQLSAQFSAYDEQHPVQQIDLFVDGKYFSTLTNLAPQPGNALTVFLNGYPVTYTVPTNSTLGTIAAGLSAALNASAITNISKTLAFAHGDRIELHSTSTNTLAEPVYFLDSSQSLQLRFYRVVYLPPPSAPTLSALGRDAAGGFRLHLETGPATGVIIQASTNLINWTSVFTNVAGGPVDFVDSSAPLYSRRFYRALGAVPATRPKLSVLGKGNGGSFKLHVEPGTAGGYLLQASTNLIQWTALVTNLAGSTMDFEDLAAANFSRRFYRASVLPQQVSTPTVSLVKQTLSGSLLKVDGAIQPFTVQVSTDLSHWSAVYTNQSVGKVSASAGSAKGSAGMLSSYLSVSRNQFLDSQAYGNQPYYISGTLQPGTWLRLDVTKTNGTVVGLAVTNQSMFASILDLTSNLFSAINSNVSLQGPDGVVAEDLAPWVFGAGSFNLRARTPGLAAAGIKTTVTGAISLGINPGVESPLKQNLSDLQPRNHLFVTAGASTLTVNFPLNTTALADGYHDLTAVAYEGSHVRSQSRIFLPINVHNTPLSATLSALDFGTNAPVQGTYHIQVAANTNNVTAIRLYATGGLLNTISNQSSATFTLAGSSLGAGLHPLYAIVNTATGRSYRTQTRWLRLTSGP